MIDITKVFNKVKQYESIIVTGHVIPDGDCYGSVMGLATTLKEHFPNKEIIPVISDFKIKFDNNLVQSVKPGVLSDEKIKQSLVFVLDLANTNRLDEKRAVDGACIIKIDHHTFERVYGEIDYVDSSSSSCCQIIAEMLIKKFKKLSVEAATYLMLGMITDTGRFLYSRDAQCFNTAGELVKFGAKLNDIYNRLYTQDLESFRFKSFVYSNFKAENKVAYIVFRKEDIHKLGVDFNYAAANVNLIAQIENYPIWISFAESDEGTVRVEIRSTRDYNINPLAVMFNGGGHHQASGCRLDNIENYIKVVKEAQNCERFLEHETE